MPRQFKVTVNNVEYDVAVLELNAGSSQTVSYTHLTLPTSDLV